MRYLFLAMLISIAGRTLSQPIPDDRVVGNQELAGLLKEEVCEQINSGGEITQAKLAEYFRHQFSQGFFYDYKTFYQRLAHYNKVYNNQQIHEKRALEHMGKFADSTQWVLPFNFLDGEPVDAYELRHLARQHKMVDVALHYFNTERNPKFIGYFTSQMRSLNAALQAGKYETIEDGNGVYEVFRSGYRILNWLWIHNMLLNEPEYSDQDQLTTIATLLQHGQHLYNRNELFVPGNHQTRGMSALAMLAIMFKDFQGTDLWLERAMLRLSEHLDREINEDGFQFERSVHYHMSDINNYYYVYQLAKINKIEIDNAWEEKLKELFTTLIKIAYPDRSAPVLQDDTEIPWAEKNDISAAMTLGYLLFSDPEFGYFAANKVDDRVYWFLSNDHVEMLENIEKQKPAYGSLSFDQTGYFIMREGWEEDDKIMIITAGLDDEKPDHQHGDMLGIQAMAHGHAILPNYQVRYSLNDFEFFKNSMVKNVALVDNELQGKIWTSNKGGSGFGKFLELPHPKVIAWKVADDFDFFAGRHDGFENVDVQYSRQIIFVKNEFWIVKDNFSSNDLHDYKQVWQGHYTVENGSDLLRATAPDATGHDILQLNHTDSVFNSGKRGKEWSLVVKNQARDFSFLTVIYPYRNYDNRLDEEADKVKIGQWMVQDRGNDQVSLSKENRTYGFGIRQLNLEQMNLQFSGKSDVYIVLNDGQAIIQSLGTINSLVTVIPAKNENIMSKELKPGEVWVVELDNNIMKSKASEQ